MKRSIPVIVFFTIHFFVIGAAHAGNSEEKFNEIVVFGESSSDTGNVSLTQCDNFTLQPAAGFPLFWAPCTPSDPDTNPPSPGYYDNDLSDGFDGRLSNGTVWAEYMADALGVERPRPSLKGGTNYAHAGAKVGPDWTTDFVGDTNLRVNLYPENPVLSPTEECPETAYNAGELVCGSEVPHINTQVQQFIDERGEFSKKSLVLIWGGANDLRDVRTQDDIGNIVANILSAVGTVAQAGGKHIVVLNQLNAALAPITQASCGESPVCLEQVEAVVTGFNDALQTALKGLRQTLREQGYRARVHYVDVYSAGEVAVRLSELFGKPFSNTTEAALLPDPSRAPYAAEIPHDAEDYLFWDVIHPTTKAYRIIAYQVCKTLDRRIRGFEPRCFEIIRGQ